MIDIWNLLWIIPLSSMMGFFIAALVTVSREDDLYIKQPPVVIKKVDTHKTISQTVDVLFSHNETVALWYRRQAEDGHYSELIWRGMAWDIPDQYRELPIIRFFGTIPETIDQADTINILVEYEGSQ